MTKADFVRRPLPSWVDMEVEHAYWEARFQVLPCARVGDVMEDCWPLIDAVYRLFLGHPRATLEQALALYRPLTERHQRALDEAQMREMFSRVWARLIKLAHGRTVPQWPDGLTPFEGDPLA